jgi:hypothetical protein
MNVRLPSFDYLWMSILFAFSLADQIVYLERPNIGPAEPYFNPKVLNASVGEQIHFIANFDETTKVVHTETIS